MRVADLSGALLDYWAVSAMGPMCAASVVDGVCKLALGEEFSPSSRWDDGGPIIEEHNIAIYRQEYSDGSLREWRASHSRDIFEGTTWLGATPLEAAMRAFVASKFGDEVLD